MKTKTDEFGFLPRERQWMNDIFASIPHIEKVMLFGSRAKGNYRPFSDVDITLIGDELTDRDFYDVCEKLDDSDLPYFYDVSIFKKLTDRDFINHIKRVGKFIYARKEYERQPLPETDKAAENAI